MKNLFVVLLLLFFVLGLNINCKKNSQESKEDYDVSVGQTINAFYGDALEMKESYGLLRGLSKDVGQRLSGSLGAEKAVVWTKKIMEGYGFDTVYLQPVMVPHWERIKNKEEAYLKQNLDSITLFHSYSHIFLST